MEIPVKKNNEYEVEIIDNGYEGEGIAKINDFTIFIPGAIEGERCKILIVKVNKTFAFGKLIEVTQKSNNRVQADCSTYLSLIHISSMEKQDMLLYRLRMHLLERF